MMKISKDHLITTLVRHHILHILLRMLLHMPLGNIIPEVIGNWILLKYPLLLCVSRNLA